MSFCKHFKVAIPRRLEIPEVLFRDCMKENVVLEYQGDKKQVRVEGSEDSRHYWIASWGEFAAKKNITVGCIVCFTIINDNHFFIETFPPTRGHKTRRRRHIGWEESARSEAVVENFAKPNRKRSSSPDSSKDVAKVVAASYLDCQREYYVPGTEAAIRKASSLQKGLLSSNSSVLMVMPSASTITASGLEFKRVFADEYCSWNHGEIILKDTRDKSWAVEWSGAKIGPEFLEFFNAHKLEQGDVCIFVVQMGGFQVHTFKAEDLGARKRSAPPALPAADPGVSDQDSMYHEINDGPPPANYSPRRNAEKPAEEYRTPVPVTTPNIASIASAAAAAVAAAAAAAAAAEEDGAVTPSGTPAVDKEEANGVHEFRISFRKDASGKYKPHIIAELALEQNQLSKLSFESPKELLKSILE